MARFKKFKCRTADSFKQLNLTNLGFCIRLDHSLNKELMIVFVKDIKKYTMNYNISNSLIDSIPVLCNKDSYRDVADALLESILIRHSLVSSS
jgi:hypothetical protein